MSSLTIIVTRTEVIQDLIPCYMLQYQVHMYNGNAYLADECLESIAYCLTDYLISLDEFESICYQRFLEFFDLYQDDDFELIQKLKTQMPYNLMTRAQLGT